MHLKIKQPSVFMVVEAHRHKQGEPYNSSPIYASTTYADALICYERSTPTDIFDIRLEEWAGYSTLQLSIKCKTN